MADTCIVCLGDLAAAPESQQPLDPATTSSRRLSIIDDDNVVAHLLPCGHNLHDSCLKPWVERANSCPICRAHFNQVELRNYIDTPAYDTYAVQDKRQQAELDPNLVLEEIVEQEEPCVVCRTIDHEHEIMYCDACEATVHVFCAGYEDSPEVWYCEACHADMTGTAARRRAQGTSRAQRGTTRRRARASEWDSVWQTVWRRLNLDLDFPFDDESSVPLYAQQTSRARNAWQRRLQIANRNGAEQAFRQTAPTLLDTPIVTRPETQDELHAWSALDEARSLQNGQSPAGRKRKTATASPASPRNGEATAARPLKRPRTRRNLMAAETAGPANPAREAGPEPASFLTSLLEEVQRQPVTKDESATEHHSGDEEHAYPQVSSPVSLSYSPASYSPASTPPRPTSPTPLTSLVAPVIMHRRSRAHETFTLSSPATSPKRTRDKEKSQTGTSGLSPQSLSYSTKSELQRMVKAALGSRYRDQEITKDDYIVINRDVSRMLYDRVGDATSLAHEDERNRLQAFAQEAVDRAVDTLKRGKSDEEGVTVPVSA